MWYVYILLCEDGSLYCGLSNNVETRFKQHKKGRGAKYTRMNKPTKIVYTEQFKTRSEALKREVQIKGWTRSDKIKLLEINEAV